MSRKRYIFSNVGSKREKREERNKSLESVTKASRPIANVIPGNVFYIDVSYQFRFISTIPIDRNCRSRVVRHGTLKGVPLY